MFVICQFWRFKLYIYTSTAKYSTLLSIVKSYIDFFLFLNLTTVKPFFRGGLIFAYFAENENSAKIKPAKIKIGKSQRDRESDHTGNGY